MRVLIVALTLGLAGVLADLTGYDTHFITVPLDSTKPNGPSLSIHYYVKNTTNANYKDGMPILYGIAGRVPVEDIANQYQLFDETSDKIDNAVVVYAEQRFFGRSIGDPLTNAKGLAQLSQLTTKAVVSDHVAIITQLAKFFKTKNFLLFGGGHGGVIAGYVAKRFQEKDLKDKFSVLGWSSSPPIKYLRRDTYPVATSGITVTEIGTQFKTIMDNANVVNNVATPCSTDKIKLLFTKIRGLVAGTDDAFINALNVVPTPVPRATAAVDPSDDQKEFNIFLRNQFLNLAYDGYAYDSAGATDANGRIKQICNLLAPLTAANLDQARFNGILAVFTNNKNRLGNKLQWKVSDDGTLTGAIRAPNQALLPAVYQDCTEYQIVYCPQATDSATDPLGGSAANGGFAGAAGCADLTGYADFIKAECTLLLKALLPAATATFDTTKLPALTEYPVSMNDHVVTTINTQSLFATSYGTFTAPGDTSLKNFAYYFKLNHADNWEFGKVRQCDGNKMAQVRYQVFRAFGCVGKFVQYANKKPEDFCSKAFADVTDDADGYPATCPELVQANDPAAKFPYGQTALTFLNYVPPPPTQPPTSPKTSAPSTPTTQPPTTKGGNGFVPTAITFLTTGLLVWFATI